MKEIMRFLEAGWIIDTCLLVVICVCVIIGNIIITIESDFNSERKEAMAILIISVMSLLCIGGSIILYYK